MAEFIDCPSVSISYDSTGKATVSFVVVSSTGSIKGSYSHISFGGVGFEGALMSAVQKVIIGGDGWCEWQIQLQGVGN